MERITWGGAGGGFISELLEGSMPSFLANQTLNPKS